MSQIRERTNGVLQVFRDDGLVTLRLNRPEKLNSVNTEMYEELLQVFDDIEQDRSVRALYLTGNGRAFCAGQDLGERKRDSGQQPIDLSRTIESKWNPLARRMHQLRVPSVCAVNGAAAGAGISIALGCDVVFASEKARFVPSFSAIGLVPDTGATYMLPRLIGKARTLGWLLSGARLDANTAKEWGMVWECIAHDDLESTAKAFAERLAHGPTLGLSGTKRAIQKALDQSFDDQLETERHLQRACGFSDDYGEGVAAFAEKRPPKFKGC